MTSLAYAALWLFVFSVPWERVIVIGGISIVSRVAGGLALGLALFSVVVTGRVRRWRVFHVLALLFVIWAGVGVMILTIQTIPKKFYTFVQLFLVLCMVWELAPTPRRQVGLLIAYLLGAYVAALVTISLFATHAGALKRFAAGGADPNSLAMTLSLALPIAWYLGMTTSRPLLRWICRAYLPVGLLVIGLTGSRGGMITAMVALLIIPLAMTHLSPGKLVGAFALLGLSGALAVAYIPETALQRLSTTGQSVEDLSFGGRGRLWKAGFNAFVAKPVMGYGPSTFVKAITPEMGSEAKVAHNSFLSVLVEEGLIGLLIFWAMLAAVFVAILRLPRLERRLALVLYTTLICTMMPLTWEDQKEVWFMMAALVGMAELPFTRAIEAVPESLPRRAAPYGSRPVAARTMERGPSPGRRLEREPPA
jgi:O-antigen ligase